MGIVKTILIILVLIAPGICAIWASFFITRRIGMALSGHKFLLWLCVVPFYTFLFFLVFVLLQSLGRVMLSWVRVSFFSTVLVDLLSPMVAALSFLVGIAFLIHSLLKTLQNDRPNENKKNRRIGLITLLVVLCLMLTPGIVWQIILSISESNKSFAESMVMYHLKHSCGAKKEGCDELRPIPLILQNKKLIVATSTYIEFDPYSSSYKNEADLDIAGFLDLRSTNFPGTDFVDPGGQESGYLHGREYTVIRAVYHYNCSYCFDSGDYDYLVLKDEKNNRFIAFPQDFSTTTEKIPWDEQVPFDGLGKDWFLEPIEQ